MNEELTPEQWVEWASELVTEKPSDIYGVWQATEMQEALREGIEIVSALVTQNGLPLREMGMLIQLLRDVKEWYEFCFETIECECELYHTCGYYDRRDEYERINHFLSLLEGVKRDGGGC